MSSLPAPAPSHRIGVTVASHAASAQSSGYARFNALRKSLSKSSVESTESTVETSEVDAAEMERRACLEDEVIADQQLDKYEAEGIIDEAHPEWAYFKLDLVRYWQVCTATHKPSICSMLTKLCRQNKMSISSYSALLWMFYLYKPLQSRVRGYSHQAK